MTKKPTLLGGIKAKLISATCMLLVAVIMVVSSTYAWFTLSTAPEVTGITTAVGANGALEIALWTGAEPTTATATGLTNAEKNATWGNIVNLNDATYGMEQIMLYPSMLGTNADGTINTSSFLMVPAYGSDGRVSAVDGTTLSGTYNPGKGGFYPDANMGVRAVGAASGLTDRQLAYRTAQNAASVARGMAQTAATKSLNTNGSALANIAIKRGTTGVSATFTQDDIASLKAIVDDLLGTESKTGALQYLEEAYTQYIIAYAASSLIDTVIDDATIREGLYSTVQNLFKAEGATLSSVVANLSTTYGVTLPATLSTPITKLENTIAEVTTAKNELTALTADSVAWADLSTPLHRLADTDAMLVNDIPAAQVMEEDNMSKLVNSVASGGLVVTMGTDGGVYADIADHCGDYTASVSIAKVEYNNLVLGPINARMETESTIEPAYLIATGNAVAGNAPAGGAQGDMPMTEFYGYIIDLAFKTNAADSDLLLQVEGTDRIYTDNANEATMGMGSTMTFKATTTDFTNDQIKGLMECIRVIFFDRSDASILKEARLDMSTAEITADGIKADIKIVTAIPEHFKTQDGTAEDTVVYLDANDAVIYSVKTTITPAGEGTPASTTYLYSYKDNGTDASITVTNTPTSEQAAVISGLEAKRVKVAASVDFVDGQENQIITALTQNTTKQISALVYLDGATITNADVAATGTSSMTGTMNLQFSSSAALVPMEYADLHVNGAEAVNVTRNLGNAAGAAVNGAAKAEKNKEYKFQLSGVSADYTYAVSYKVGESGVDTTITATNGVYTIPAAAVTDDIVITVTATAASGN